MGKVVLVFHSAILALHPPVRSPSLSRAPIQDFPQPPSLTPFSLYLHRGRAGESRPTAFTAIHSVVPNGSPSLISESLEDLRDKNFGHP